LIDLATAERALHSPVAQLAFDKEMGKAFDLGIVGSVERPEPMTEIEAKRFERENLPWVSLCGVGVKHAKVCELDTWAGTLKFIKNLNRYLQSDYIKHERNYES